jgi:hypothetical protein
MHWLGPRVQLTDFLAALQEDHLPVPEDRFEALLLAV